MLNTKNIKQISIKHTLLSPSLRLPAALSYYNFHDHRTGWLLDTKSSGRCTADAQVD